jgi:hypothetical protein
MVWKLLRTVGKAVVEAARFVSPPQVQYIANAVNAIAPEDTHLIEQQQQIQLAQLKLQYIQHQQTLASQGQLARLNHEQAQALQAYVEQAKNLRTQQQQAFEQWRINEQKTLQLELLRRNHQLQRELVTYQRQTALGAIAEHKRLENSPIWLVASDILHSSVEGHIPLRVFLAPPRVQFERFVHISQTSQDFPNIELSLAEGLRQFFRHYELAGRKIDFLAGAWVSKSFHSEASIKALYSVLKSEPTLVLESEVDGDYLNFRTAYWGANWSSYRYESVLSHLSYREILYESAKDRARRWFKIRQQLIAQGHKPKSVDNLYGKEYLVNLVKLYQELQLKKIGIQPDDLDLNYQINKKDLEDLYQFLIVYHCLFAGLVADEYFLCEYNLPPLLPSLLPKLTQEVNDSEIIAEIYQAVATYYEDVYKTLEQTRSGLLPDLTLNLALSLKPLAQDYARQQVIKSLHYWLKLRGVEAKKDNIPSLLQVVAKVIKQEDQPYLEKLNYCLAKIGENARIKPNHSAYLPQRIAPKGKRQDLPKLHLQKTLQGHTRSIHCLSVSRNGKYLASGSEDQCIYIWELATERILHIFQGHSQPISSLLFHPKGNILMSIANDQTIRLWNLNTGEIMRTLTGLTATGFGGILSEDQKLLLSHNQRQAINIWNLQTGQKQQTLTLPHGTIQGLTISPGGNYIAAGGEAGEITLWKLPNPQPRGVLKNHSQAIRGLAINRDNQTLVSGGDKGRITIWDLTTGKVKATGIGHQGMVSAIALSPNGDIISGGVDQMIKIWRTRA